MNSEQRPHRPHNGEQKDALKKYVSPQLHIYGDLRRITQTVAFTNLMDGANCRLTPRCRTS